MFKLIDVMTKECKAIAVPHFFFHAFDLSIPVENFELLGGPMKSEDSRIFFFFDVKTQEYW